MFEIDEMRSYLKRKTNTIWIVYALDRISNNVVNFSIRARTKRTLSCVTDSIIISNPNKVYTDKLIHYKSLLNKIVLKNTCFGTNRIERKNLSVRTHLKRLNRKKMLFKKFCNLNVCFENIFFGVNTNIRFFN